MTEIAATELCENCFVAADQLQATSSGVGGVVGLFSKLFNTDGFPPRWECGTAWSAELGWLHIGSDFAIFGAYLAIPLVLTFFILRRSDVPFPPVFWLFVAFIALCGIGHLIEGTIFWIPWYRLSGLVKLMTALVSWLTVAALIWVVPSALSLPGLARLNEELNREITNRKEIEQAFRERAEELQQINEELAFVGRTTVSREDRIIDLKQEVNDLLIRLGEQPRYLSDAGGPSNSID